MRHISYALAAVLACALIALCTVALGNALARVPALSDASVAPTFSASLRPGGAVDVPRQCPRAGFFTEFQAYRHDGSALAPQHWHDGGTLIVWHGAHGRVTFDGLTFRNATRARVIVGAWCS